MFETLKVQAEPTEPHATLPRSGRKAMSRTRVSVVNRSYLEGDQKAQMPDQSPTPSLQDSMRSIKIKANKGAAGSSAAAIKSLKHTHN